MSKFLCLSLLFPKIGSNITKFYVITIIVTFLQLVLNISVQLLGLNIARLHTQEGFHILVGSAIILQGRRKKIIIFEYPYCSYTTLKIHFQITCHSNKKLCLLGKNTLIFMKNCFIPWTDRWSISIPSHGHSIMKCTDILC